MKYPKPIGYNVNDAYKQVMAEKNIRNSLNVNAENEDKNTRMKLQEYIIVLIKKGINRSEILKELYNNKEYLKYEKFFATWIEHNVKKYGRQEEEER